MGLLDRFRGLRDVEGVRLTVTAPDEFRWADGTLPVALTFQNRGKADQVVTQVEVKLERRLAAHYTSSFLYTVLDRVVVPVGQTVVRDYAVPLVLDDRPVDPSHLDQVSTTLAALVRRVAVGTVGFTGPCSLLAMAVYEGSSRPGSATTEITAL